VFLTFADLDFVLSGDKDFQDVFSQVHGDGSLFKSSSHFLLVARIGMNHIPFGFFRLRLGDDDVIIGIFFSLGFNRVFDLRFLDFLRFFDLWLRFVWRGRFRFFVCFFSHVI